MPPDEELQSETTDPPEQPATQPETPPAGDGMPDWAKALDTRVGALESRSLGASEPTKPEPETPTSDHGTNTPESAQPRREYIRERVPIRDHPLFGRPLQRFRRG